MPQVIANPDEMRRFAVALDKLSESLQHKKFATSHAFEHLRQSWKDAKYNEFEKTFTTTCQELDQFLKMTKIYADFLRRKAAKLDQFLGKS